jgi:hypothetical protein
MKKSLNIILLLSLVFLLLRCKDDDGPISSTEKNVEIYCTYGDTAGQQVSDNESITVDLGDTLFVSLAVTGIESDSVYLIGTNNFEIEKTDSLEYSCIATETGEGDIAVYSDNLSSDLLSNFFVEVLSFYYTLIVIEEPSFVIDVANESLETKIQAELEKSYARNTFDQYFLYCKSVEGGDLQINVYDTNSTITGTFTSSNVLYLSDITMYYNNATYSFSLEESELGNNNRYLNLDLTKEFQTEYPSETINEVSITMLVLINRKE